MLLADECHRSWHRELRAIRQSERALTANYILSLLHDAEYVSRCALALSPWPCLPNLRCGAWYVQPELAHSSCYFKSTDGHARTWQFSLKRLNWHVALLAAREGGLLIVDATRKGKRYPDALTKTIPIWCAVLNAAAALIEATLAASAAGSARPDAEGCPATAAPLASGPEEAEAEAEAVAVLPEWLPPSECAQIRALLPGWAQGLVRSCSAPMRLELAAALRGRALVPLWCAQPELPARPEALRRAAALLASASASAGRPARSPVPLPIPLLCLSASAPVSEAASREAHSWTFVQGAGDDEESWARGLRPQAFWAHAQALAGLARQGGGACEAALEELRRPPGPAGACGAAGPGEAGPAAAAAAAAAAARPRSPGADLAGTATAAAEAGGGAAAARCAGPGVRLRAWGPGALALLRAGGALLLVGGSPEQVEAAQAAAGPGPGPGPGPSPGSPHSPSGSHRSRSPAPASPAPQPQQPPGPQPAAPPPSPPPPPCAAEPAGSPRLCVLNLGRRQGSRATARGEPADLWPARLFPAAVAFARARAAAASSAHARGSGVAPGPAAHGGCGSAAQAHAASAQPPQPQPQPQEQQTEQQPQPQPQEQEQQTEQQQWQPQPELVVALGSECDEEAAVAVALCLLLALDEPGWPVGPGVRGQRGGLAGTRSAAEVKEAVRAKLVLLQSLRVGSQLPLSRALVQQLHRFLMS